MDTRLEQRIEAFSAITTYIVTNARARPDAEPQERDFLNGLKSVSKALKELPPVNTWIQFAIKKNPATKKYAFEVKHAKGTSYAIVSQADITLLLNRIQVANINAQFDPRNLLCKVAPESTEYKEQHQLAEVAQRFWNFKIMPGVLSGLDAEFFALLPTFGGALKEIPTDHLLGCTIRKEGTCFTLEVLRQDTPTYTFKVPKAEIDAVWTYLQDPLKAFRLLNPALKAEAHHTPGMRIIKADYATTKNAIITKHKQKGIEESKASDASLTSSKLNSAAVDVAQSRLKFFSPDEKALPPSTQTAADANKPSKAAIYHHVRKNTKPSSTT